MMNRGDMHENTHVEVITRGVCVVDGHVLLCHGRKSELTYLPGGHIEFGETARQALVREIQEELGRDSTAGRFLGCCEHAFIQKGVPHAEINLVFELAIPRLVPGESVAAAEAWIGFRWHPLNELRTARLEPAPLCDALGTWLQTPGGHVVSGNAWGFTAESSRPPG